MPAGSYRSVAGYAAESLVIGRAMLCGYIIFFKAWRDSKYDAVLDADGVLYRVEIKGTTVDIDSAGATISTTSGARAGQQISREAESRKKPLNTTDCEWLIATTSMTGVCWIIPVEVIEILEVEQLPVKNLGLYREKWDIFTSAPEIVRPYLKAGFKNLALSELEKVSNCLSIDYQKFSDPSKRVFRLDPSNTRSRGYRIRDYSAFLALAIWQKLFRDITI